MDWLRNHVIVVVRIFDQNDNAKIKNLTNDHKFC
jgi:hypothetical protein